MDFIELQNCTSNFQVDLWNALSEKNLSKFLVCLKRNANPEKINEENRLSVFDKACATPGCAKFITACLTFGADPNKFNERRRKYPIHFAIESKDYDNISALLDKGIVDIDVLYENLTPIHQLFHYMNDENFNETNKIMQLLLKHRPNLNIPNRRECVPILTIAQHDDLSHDQKTNIIKQLLNNPFELPVELDFYDEGEARDYINENFPTIKLPPERTNSSAIDFYKLFSLLENNLESDFLESFEKYCINVTGDDNKRNSHVERLCTETQGERTLLAKAVEKGLLKAVKILLDKGADINYRRDEKATSAISIACRWGQPEILQFLFKHPDLKLFPNECLLIDIIYQLDNRRNKRYWDCFKILLENLPRKEINKLDKNNATALHYAVKYKNETATLALLEKGAYIGIENIFSELPISEMDPKVLEKGFNSCISVNNYSPGDPNYEIIYDYRNLLPTPDRTNKRNIITKRNIDEMTPIDFMCKSNELKYLVQHPLIASFLYFKWHRLQNIFYLNFIVYFIYCISFILYLMCYYGKNSSTTTSGIAGILQCICFFGAIFMLLRELLQMFMSISSYVRSFENYIELGLPIMTFIILFGNVEDDHTKRTQIVISILFSFFEVFILFGSLPYLQFSTYFIMLRTVAKSFLRSLMLYAIILVSFALCFYVMLGGGGEEMKPNSTNSTEENDDSPFNKFINPGVSIIKTIVMLTGEFDAASIEFSKNGFSYFLFLMFVFLISSVLFNLLNGLAVSDTQAIKSEAELMNLISKAELLSRYEENFSSCYYTDFRGKWLKWASSFTRVFPNLLPNHKAIVYPNQQNSVIIPQATNLSKQIFKGSNENLITPNDMQTIYLESAEDSKCFGLNRKKMDAKIVKYTRNLLTAAKLSREEDSKDLELWYEIDCINNRLAKMEKREIDFNTKIDTVLRKMETIENSIQRLIDRN